MPNYRSSYSPTTSPGDESEAWQARNTARNATYDASGGAPFVAPSQYQRLTEMQAMPAGSRKPGMENVDMSMLPTPAELMQRKQDRAQGYAGQAAAPSVAGASPSSAAPPISPNGASTGPKSANYGVMRRSGINPATNKPYDHVAVDAKGEARDLDPATGQPFAGFEDAVRASQNSRAEAGMSIPYGGAPSKNRSFDRTPVQQMYPNAAPDPASQAWAENSSGRFNYQGPVQAPQSTGAAPMGMPRPSVAEAGILATPPRPRPSVNGQTFPRPAAPAPAAAPIANSPAPTQAPMQPVREGAVERDVRRLGEFADQVTGAPERNEASRVRSQERSSKEEAEQFKRRAKTPQFRQQIDTGTTNFWENPFMASFDPAAMRTTSPTQQFKTSLKQGRATQVAANVFTRPRNLSMRNGYLPA